MRQFFLFFSLLFTAISTQAAMTDKVIDLTQSWVGYASLLVFAFAYVLVILEEKIHLRKSKPVLAAAGIIWVLIAIVGKQNGFDENVEHHVRENFLEYAELFFFLLVAMTYVNAMLERGVFDELRNKLVERSFTYKSLFWITGFLTFFISPIVNNLTVALIMCAVVMAVGKDQPKFIAIACVNIVVASNAGGVFNPFGDITTLMVWQKGILAFQEFFRLFLPALANFLVPAIVMHFFVPSGLPKVENESKKSIEVGGYVVVFLFVLTIITSVLFHMLLNLPPVLGMMTGLAYLKFFGYYLRRKSPSFPKTQGSILGNTSDPYQFDVFNRIAQAEWDTLFFFYGVILCVGGLSFIGHLSLVSELMYGQLGATSANVLVGFASAIVDNIPVMFAVLTMHPDMSTFQWLLVTYTAGVGGSLLSVGSASGVALMGQSKGHYTFMTHIKWMPVILLGYAAGIATHFLINA